MDRGRRLASGHRTGREIETLGDPGEYGNPALSRDGARLAYSLADPRTAKIDIWIRDLARGVSSRFTFIGNNDVPLWSPDGTTVVFGSNRSGQQDLYEKSASGQGEDKVFFKSDQFNIPADWSRDGRHVLVQSHGQRFLFVAPLGRDALVPTTVVLNWSAGLTR